MKPDRASLIEAITEAGGNPSRHCEKAYLDKKLLIFTCKQDTDRHFLCFLRSATANQLNLLIK